MSEAPDKRSSRLTANALSSRGLGRSQSALIEEGDLVAVSLNLEVVVGVSNSEKNQVDQEKVAAVLQLVVAPHEWRCGWR